MFVSLVLLARCTPIHFLLLPHILQNHLSWFILTYTALFLLSHAKAIATGSHSLMMQPPTPPATPPIVHMPLPAPVAPPAPDLHHTSRISGPPGEWWKVRRSAEPEADPPVIWSEDEDEDGEYTNSASTPEPFKQAMHGQQSKGWQEAATLEYNTLVETESLRIWLGLQS